MDSGHCCMDGVDWTCCIGGCGGREVVIRRQGGRVGRHGGFGGGWGWFGSFSGHDVSYRELLLMGYFLFRIWKNGE